ncbi:MAG: hypothetical protein K9K62_03745 [Desulfobacteraceae bacterium]|nr:hypothetical protein [Desulfobacteraceae bacterium]
MASATSASEYRAPQARQRKTVRAQARRTNNDALPHSGQGNFRAVENLCIINGSPIPFAALILPGKEKRFCFCLDKTQQFIHVMYDSWMKPLPKRNP